MAKGALDHGASPPCRVRGAASRCALHRQAREASTTRTSRVCRPGILTVVSGRAGGSTSAESVPSRQVMSEHQVPSDATPDNTWKPRAQYAAPEVGAHADISSIDAAPAHRIEFHAPKAGTEDGSSYVAAGETVSPRGFTIQPLQGQDPLDPQRLNGPIDSDEQQRLQMRSRSSFTAIRPISIPTLT